MLLDNVLYNERKPIVIWGLDCADIFLNRVLELQEKINRSCSIINDLI